MIERLPGSAVGIVANPIASKDIRRIVTQASIVPNHEKSNIVRRVLLGLAATPVERVWYVPDDAGIVARALERLDVPFSVAPLDGPWRGTAADTVEAARQLEHIQAGCFITLGGDGTARAAIKGSRTLPLLPISTGTNNAFPLLIEGTLAGLAAGTVATGATAAIRSVPVLELWHHNTLKDIALIDVAAISGGVGAKAVWDSTTIQAVVTTRLQPGTIGLSAIGGHLGVPVPATTVAVGLRLGPHGYVVDAPIAPGVVKQINIETYVWLDDEHEFDLPAPATLALDGEREYTIRSGERWWVRAVRHGGRVIDPHAALSYFSRNRASINDVKS